MEKLYTYSEVAKHLRVPDSTVRYWASTRMISTYKLGKHQRIKESDLKAFLEKGRREEVGNNGNIFKKTQGRDGSLVH